METGRKKKRQSGFEERVEGGNWNDKFGLRV